MQQNARDFAQILLGCRDVKLANWAQFFATVSQEVPVGMPKPYVCTM